MLAPVVRPVQWLIICAALLAGCGSKTGITGGLVVEVKYSRVSAGDGCVRLDVTSPGFDTVLSSVRLKGARDGSVKFGVGRGPGWGDAVNIIASLHANDCGEA